MMGNKRNAGIYLLRIISMCMIIVKHMNGYGKVSESKGQIPRLG